MAMEEGLKPNGKPYRIAICDDRRTDVVNLRQILESRQFKVVEVFENGRALVEWYKKNAGEVDAIILDIIMPVLDGYAAFFELIKITPRPRIVFVSVENTAALIKKLIERGAYDFITKPIKRDVIIDRVSRVVRRPPPVD